MIHCVIVSPLFFFAGVMLQSIVSQFLTLLEMSFFILGKIRSSICIRTFSMLISVDKKD